MKMHLINAKSAVEFPAKPAVSEQCKEFIMACLTPDVRQRPTCEQLLAHAYLQKKVAKSKGGGTFKEPAPVIKN